METRNSVVLITGGASGIGEAAAKALAKEGARVVLGDTNEEQLKRVADEISDEGGKVKYRVVNVTKEEEVRELVQFAVEQFGQLNVVLACAGIARDSFFITPDKESGKVKKIHDYRTVAIRARRKHDRCVSHAQGGRYGNGKQ